VLANPVPKATLYEFTDSGVTIRLQYYVRLRGTLGGLDIRADILARVRDALAAAGIRVATPAGDVRLPTSPPVPALAAPGSAA
jgi:small-conductance mechanosensitive channel